FYPGPPAVEMLVPGPGPRSRRRPVLIHHVPVRDTDGRPSGVLHLFGPQGEPDPKEPVAVTWSVDVGPPGNYLG
ncbi:MAG TPA: hypothetical protein VFH00_01465, partial [Candidatus Nitrosotalea sp.]|nr:hypothetical protein [Candidatus Nitrosotalea sp.]